MQKKLSNQMGLLSFGADLADAAMGECVAGVDEVGRGPLAGAVVAAAVILDLKNPIEGLMDSKKLSAKRREALSAEIREKSIAWSLASASVEEIDDINILHASMLAMKRAVETLSVQPSMVFVDGNRLPEWSYPSEAIVKGDSKVAEIAAASIVAKVARDADMLQLHEQYPDYGFDRHKGYPTKMHLECLALHGPSIIHRRSFAPVRRLLNNKISH